MPIAEFWEVTMLRAIWVLPALLLLTLLVGCGGGSNSAGSAQQRGSVSGSVLSAMSTPGTAMTVSLDGKNISAPVAANGAFTLNNVPPGIYTLVAQAGDQAGAMVVTVAGGKVTNIGQMELSGAGQISGLVTDTSTHAPLANAQVVVTNVAATTDTTPLPVRACQTDMAGSYTVDALPEGAYLVTVNKGGYATATLDLTVSAGATTAGDVALQAATTSTGSVAGSVTSTNTDGAVVPVSGVFIVLTSSTSGAQPPIVAMPATATSASNQSIALYPTIGPSWQQYYTYTADDGSYHLDGVPAGSYTATAMRSGFNSQSQSVTIVAKQTTALSFTLTMQVIPMGTISGTVTDATTQQPIAGANVTAIMYGVGSSGSGSTAGGSVGNAGTKHRAAIASPAMPSGFQVSATTDSNGAYTLLVPTAVGAISVSAAGYTYTTMPVTVALNQTVTVNIPLTAVQSITLSGTVTAPVGATSDAIAPVAGATVYATPNGIVYNPIIVGPNLPTTSSSAGTTTSTGATCIGPAYTATTDAQGAYTLTVPSCYYTIYAAQSNLMSSVTSQTFSQNTVLNFALLVSPVPPMPTPIPLSLKKSKG
jgi:hypothetical protein